MSAESAALAAVPHDHVVQFYADDAELISAVGDFLAPAARGEAVAVVIATEVHRRGLTEGFAAAGADVEALRASGSLVELDAAATLAAFRRDGRIDPTAFAAVVGGLLRDVGRTGRPVRAFGEMVALLWEAGEVVAALELEALWNELGSELEFSLFCGYPATAVRGADHADAVHRLCHDLHSSVVAPAERSLEAEYPARLTAPRRARRDVVAALRAWGCEGHLVDDAELVVGELAANAVLHARSAFALRVRMEDATVHIAVADDRALEPGRRLSVRLPHGLSLVDVLTARWGVDRRPRGKVVWAELPA